MQDSRVTFDNYLKFLKIIIARNSIGNLIVNFTSVPLDKKFIYVFLLVYIYFNYIKIYQHVYDFIKILKKYTNNYLLLEIML